ncbi:DUF4124 domain-containing protein [Massilia sp. PAMC28688]|uniref:DUF4124 domain-containing protein n=1 Tax=Massilia sp. PAMC28688 TaxID=2861283 RepID=UPI001C6308E8|nr:DUF4124 domain-containing protein [Massilia sp. PAMC28688]QYF95458.1 DUF4124 domain-containing protein [Massilia sp. PAMC28688]
MVNTRAIVLVTGILACSGVQAQQMYKTVGPDGKVTFSDRPALESAAKLSVMRSNTLRPVNTPGAPAEAAPAPLPAPAVASGPAPEITPQVEAAIMAVMAQAEFPRRFYPFCNSTEASARAFNQAANGWKARNMDAVEHQRRLLMQVVTPVKRAEMQAKVAALVNGEVAKVGNLTVPERQKWCAEAIVELRGDSSTISQPDMMAVAIPSPRRR